MQEAARTAVELRALGLANQRLAINGVFRASQPGQDPVADAIERLGREAMGQMPDALAQLPRDEVPLRAFDTVGLPALRALLGGGAYRPLRQRRRTGAALQAEPLAALADALAAKGHGLIMVMGKGGVGETTIAAALAVGLVQRGHSVHLTTTDPAAHVQSQLDGSLPGLKWGASTPGRNAGLHRQDHGHARQGSGRRRPRAAAGRPAVALPPKRWPCSMPSAAW